MNITIRNPVLSGFFPDPSFIRVGDDFYIANSTFEYLPGVVFNHSKDLVNWRMIGHALTRPDQINLLGVDNSAGSWAPSLSYSEGQFWLIFTNVRTSAKGKPFKDSHVYLMTSPTINGPWSTPIYMNSIGFDPSLYHDSDGKKYLLNMQWDHRQNIFSFAGIVMQEYDHSQQKLVGSCRELLRKEVLCEGPNLYKVDDWYYLMMAEGGTGWNHGISMARSKNIWGPYELDKEEAVLTTRHDPSHPLLKAGHGELVQLKNGDWWMAHLNSRPLKTNRTPSIDSCSPENIDDPFFGYRCTLGRETSLQKLIVDEDGWFRLEDGGVLPKVEVQAPDLPTHPWPKIPDCDEFNLSSLGVHYSTLRSFPNSSWLSLEERPGWLRIYGRESPSSLHEQSLVARRVTSFNFLAETKIDFNPQRFTQFAGLLAWYNTENFIYLRVAYHEINGRFIDIVTMENDEYNEVEHSVQQISDEDDVYLRMDVQGEILQCLISFNGEDWTQLGEAFDASKLSDDYPSGLFFTGLHMALACHDLAGQGAKADFDYFKLVDTAVSSEPS